jgi:hypothetical protein
VASLSFLKRLFRRERKQVVEPLHGGVSSQEADAERDAKAAARRQMEGEVASDRARRGATDERPGDHA